jgi:hypothetical protein
LLEYVRPVLALTLTPVMIDNLSSHKSDDVRHAIEAVGATVLFLPSRNPTA